MKSTIHPVTPPNQDITLPHGCITFAIFNLLSKIQTYETNITNQTTRQDLAHLCHTTAKALENAADRFRVTPAKAQVLRQLQTEIENTTHN